MRYILKDGYIDEISFGATIECKNQTCTEYTGEIPTDYSSLEEWAIGEDGKLNAWKIVDDNLVYDENKYNELQSQYERELEENSCATHKWVNDKLKNINSIYDDELSKTIESSSSFEIDDAKDNTDIISIKITPNKEISNNLKIKITNANILENTGVTTTLNGLTFTINEDRSITINGTSTEATEFILNGSLTNTDDLFFLKKNQNYYQCGLDKNIDINLYNYDGTDRTLINSSSNGVITLSQTAYITCVSLSIASGKKFKNKKIYPMITLGNEEKSYVQYKGNDLVTIDFGEYNFSGNDYIDIERDKETFYKFYDLFVNEDLSINEDITIVDAELRTIYYSIKQLQVYGDLTIVQIDKDVNTEMKYFSKDYLNEKFAVIEARENEIELSVGEKVGKNEVISSINLSPEEIKLNANKIALEGYTTINQGFSVDTNGNMSCKNASMTNANVTGGTITGATLNLSDVGGSTNPSIAITNKNNNNRRVYITSDYFGIQGGGHLIYLSTNDEFFPDNTSVAILEVDNKFRVDNHGTAWVSNNLYVTNSIICTSLTQTSLESIKKNFERFNNGLEIIKNADIYKYHLRNQDNSEKKHIGLVIGEEYKTPSEVLNNENDSIDLYSMCSIAWQSIKELNNKIEILEKRIEELEADK